MYRVVREVSWYTTPGISVNLLCRQSRTRRFCKLASWSGRLVITFSDKLTVTRSTQHPISGARWPASYVESGNREMFDLKWSSLVFPSSLQGGCPWDVMVAE
eukprot:TRINITY_DN35174_c0_g1_i1.p1 TRINITY_DN35174_c0_g1~~TRINITY_DN35174_c0_g1_i1.p1  ORF type:complete len:102 (+),score=18.29 TRINITY_DN35174_c0_g1_i1:274-579(+)